MSEPSAEKQPDRRPTVLIVDYVEENITLLRRLLGPKGYSVDGAISGSLALKSIEESPPDIVLLDLVMPEMDGITGLAEHDANVRALEAGADDFLLRPIDSVLLNARLRSSLRSKALQDENRRYQERLEHYNEELEDRIQQRTLQLERSQHAAVFSLAKLSESRDPETGEHLERIRSYTRHIATHFARMPKFKDVIDSDFISALYYASPLHDIGKVGIPDRILLKPGKLTETEFDIMKSHTVVGGETLKAALQEVGHDPLLTMGQDVAFHHHERWDGGGYPSGLKAEDIPLSARIVALADIYDALTSKRPYKEPFSHEKSRAIILEGRGGHLDPDVVDAFVAKEQEFVKTRYEHKDSGGPTRIQKLIESLEEADQATES
jgi:putative two-component system response regulator